MFDSETAEALAGIQASQLDPVYARFRDQTRFWIQRVAVPLLMVIGLFGNSITVIIMTRRRMRSTTNMYLAALALVDMLYLVLTFVLGLSHYPNMAEHKYYVYWKLRPFLMMLIDACSNTSVWLTVTFTIERYIAVKYPMKGKVWCTEARAKILIISVFAFGILFASPVPFEWKVVERRIPSRSNTDGDNQLMRTAVNSTNEKVSLFPVRDGTGMDYKDPINYALANHNAREASDDLPSSIIKPSVIEYSYKSVLALDYTEFGKNDKFKTIYYSSTAIIFYFIPLFSLMLFNGFLIKSVHDSQRERTKMVGPNPDRPVRCSLVKAESSTTSNGRTSDQPFSGESSPDLLPGADSRCKSKPLLCIGKQEEQKMYGNNTIIGLQSPSLNNARQDEDGGLTSVEPFKEAFKTRPAFDSNARINSIKSIPRGAGEKEYSGKLSELNVQINCDNESVTYEEKEVKPNKASNEISIQASNQVTLAERNSSEAVKIIGERISKSRIFSGRRLLNYSNASSKSSGHTSQIVSSSSQERRITIMLIAVVILFLVCQVPSAAMLLYTSVREQEPNTNEHALVLAFGNIFNFLMAVNAAGNFILYSFLSKKYRRTFIILFCSCLKSKHRDNSVETRRCLSVRFDSSRQSIKNCSSNYQNKPHDTPL